MPETLDGCPVVSVFTLYSDNPNPVGVNPFHFVNKAVDGSPIKKHQQTHYFLQPNLL